TAALFSAVAPAQAQDKKPNILFIMGDDIGWMQPSCYHRGLMVGETPNIDRIASEGGMFMHYYAESSCTAGRTAFFTGMHPYRAAFTPRSALAWHRHAQSFGRSPPTARPRTTRARTKVRSRSSARKRWTRKSPPT